MRLQTFFTHFECLADAPTSIPKLRELILQLAVQGKLVRQDPDDEDALMLLGEIQKEKNRQLKERKSKQIEPLRQITENDFLDVAIPQGWSWAWLGDLARFIDYRGKTPNKTAHGVKLLTAKNIRMGFISDVPKEFISEETYVDVMTRGFPKFGDILFTTEAPLGNVAQLLTHERVALAQRVIDLRTFEPFFAEYLKVCLMSSFMQKALIERATGMTATGIKASKLKQLPIPVPPLNEQKRIVARVNQLMQLCDELDERQQAKRKIRICLNKAALAPLKKASSLAPMKFEQAIIRLADNFDLLYDSIDTVTQLRSTILQLAIQGKLVTQDLSEEPTSVLLEKVKQEKNRLIKERRISNTKPLPELEDFEKSFALPEHWSWIRMGEVVDQRLGKMLDKNKNRGELYPYLRNTNVQWLRFDLSDVKEMRFEAGELEEYGLRDGDLLVCEGGEPGRCAIWSGEIEPIMFQKAIHRIRPFGGINSWFLLYRLWADALSGSLEKHFTGATIKHLTGQELAKYVIALPPLAEQKRIVAKVNQLMSLCDELETNLRQGEADSEKLMNAAVQHVLNTISPRH